MKRLFRFQYFTGSNQPLLHQSRDTVIFVELINLLMNSGYHYEDTFLNFPHPKDKNRCDVDLKPEDLMVLTTRPPLTDRYQRRKIYRSGHFLEKNMLTMINTCFTSLSRHVLYLSGHLAAHLRKGYENRATIEFYVHSNKTSRAAGYKKLACYDENYERDFKTWNPTGSERLSKSCAFLIFFQASALMPCKTLFVFGMGGEEGLIFSRMLRNGLWEKLKIDLDGSSRFVMVEFNDFIPGELTNLDFVRNLHYEVILDHFLD